jgi:hypothetical protein
VPPTGWISVKFDIGDIFENPNVVKNRQNSQALCSKILVCFIVAGDITSL